MGKIESKQFDYIEEKQKQLLINWKITLRKVVIFWPIQASVLQTVINSQLFFMITQKDF